MQQPLVYFEALHEDMVPGQRSEEPCIELERLNYSTR